MDNGIDLQKYYKMKDDGKNPLEVFTTAKKDGLQNFKCLLVLQEVFGLTLDQSRKFSYKYHGLDENGKSK